MLVNDSGFAGNIIKKYTAFGRPESGASLVFLESGQKPQTVKSSYELLLTFYNTWQNYVKSGAKFSFNWNMAAQLLTKGIKRRLTDQRLLVFGSITDIFVNRGSRPDLAKKAERELVKILSSEFYKMDGRRQERQIEKLAGTKHFVSAIERRVKIQESVIAELRQKITALTNFPESSIRKITGQVMRQMEQEMHLERLRRGI
ncbi:MAG: hypothetical protein NC242_10375 [Roseburia sp.]|nr:hypothetical protein [Roseburia sp.]MCM1431877.1 hypothetical protein [Muribaculaceae bacterium]